MDYDSCSDKSIQQQLSENSEEADLDQARRQQMLKSLNLLGNDDSMNEFAKDQKQEVQAMFKDADQKAKTSKDRQQNSAKKLRAKDALQFFERMKILVLTHILQSTKKIKETLMENEQIFPKILSHFSQSQLIQYSSKFKIKQPMNISMQQFLPFFSAIVNSVQHKTSEFTSQQILWAICLSLAIGVRKVNFIDISHLGLESIYELNFKKKGKNFQRAKPLDNLRHKISLQQLQNSSNNDFEFQDLSTYSYANVKAKVNQKGSSLSQSWDKNSAKKKLQSNKFLDSIYQFFCPLQRKWITFQLETCQIWDQLDSFKQNWLDGKAIIGFYSVRVIGFKPQFQPYSKYRKLGKIELKDLSTYFADKYEFVTKRRFRLGCGNIYKDLINLGSLENDQVLSLMTPMQKLIVEITDQGDQQLFMANFPTNNTMMRKSQRYVVPSQVPKYMVLKENAKDIGQMFRQEKVFRKKDLVRVSSKMGWADYGRMIKQGQEPVKVTQNKGGNKSNLYLFSQTQPYQLKVNPETGQFIADQQYNSIYVPPNFKCPQNCLIVPQNIGYICKKQKVRHCKVVQGFNRANMRIVPNQIGVIIYKQDYDRVMQLYYERLQKMQKKKNERKDDEVISMWRKLFKCIELKQQISQQYQRK